MSLKVTFLIQFHNCKYFYTHLCNETDNIIIHWCYDRGSRSRHSDHIKKKKMIKVELFNGEPVICNSICADPLHSFLFILRMQDDDDIQEVYFSNIKHISAA